MCRSRCPLTVAGAVAGFHRVPFSPGVARTVTEMAYSSRGIIASFVRVQAATREDAVRVGGLAWETMGRSWMPSNLR